MNGSSIEMGRVVDDIAAQGKATGERAFERTMDGFKQSAAAASAGFEQAQAGLKDSMEKAMRSSEQFLSFGRGNLEAFVRSSQIFTAGMQGMTKHLTSHAQANLDEAMGAMRSLTGVKSLKEAVDLQTGMTRTAMEKMAAATTAWTEQSMRLVEETVEPLTERMTAAVEVFSPRG